MAEFSNKKINSFLIRFYFLISVSLIQFVILFWGYNKDFYDSLIDSFIFSFILFLIGFVIIFPIKYVALEKMKFSIFISNHLINAGIISGIWTSVSYFIISKFFQLSSEYILFLKDSLFWRFFLGIIFYFLVVSVYYLISFYDNLINKTKREKELTLLIKEAELKSLRYQINPHFLFNSFNSINYLIQSNPSKASEMLITLSDYFRDIFSGDENDFATFRDELENIKRYLAIEKIRFEEKIRLDFDIDNSAYDVKIPHMILQPLFENIIKHAVHDAIETVIINFHAKIYDNFLIIELENNFEDSTTKKIGAGIGLMNIKNRIVNIYGSQELFNYKKEDNRFTVTLKIPIISNEKRN